MKEIDDIIAASGEEIPDTPEEDEEGVSWTLEENTAVKKIDRHAFLYRETMVPQMLWEFFAVADLEPGRKKRIVLWHGNTCYDAFIEKTVHTAPRTRMIWGPPLGAMLHREYPQWLAFFRKHREDAGNAPSLRFTRGAEPGHYDIGLEGVRPHEAPAGFSMPVKPGEAIDHKTLQAIFRCGPQGSMRWSAAAESLVLIADHTKPACTDEWTGKIFHFTGRGATGGGRPVPQNKILAASRETGTGLYLFEVFSAGQYVYMGEAELMADPYRSRQPDTTNTPQDVWVYPLQLRSHKSPPPVKKG
jgi:hypothetical protein